MVSALPEVPSRYGQHTEDAVPQRPFSKVKHMEKVWTGPTLGVLLVLPRL